MLTRLRYHLNSARTHAGFRRYAANTSWMFAEQMLRMVAGLLVGIWVARYLGPAQFGIFSYTIAFVALFSSVAKLGLDSIVVRDLVNEPEQRDLYLGTAFWLKLIGSVAMLAVMAFVVQLTSNDAITNLYIFIIGSGTIFQSFEVVDFYFQSKVISKFVSICKLTQLFISSLLKLYLILTGRDLIWFVLISLVDQITLALSFYLAYRYQKLGSFYRNFNRPIAKQLLRDSWPQIINGIAIMFYIRIDQIMVKEILGAEKVGLYTAAIRLSEVWYFLPMLISQSLFPSIVSAKKSNSVLYAIRLNRLYSLLTLIAIGVALPMTFFSDWLITLLYGSAYTEAGSVLMLHIWGGIFVSLGVVGGRWLISENLQHLMLYRTIGGAISNVLLSIILIPIFGIMGAASATFISIVLSSYLLDYVDKRTRQMFYQKSKSLLLIDLLKRI